MMNPIITKELKYRIENLCEDEDGQKAYDIDPKGVKSKIIRGLNRQHEECAEIEDSNISIEEYIETSVDTRESMIEEGHEFIVSYNESYDDYELI